MRATSSEQNIDFDRTANVPATCLRSATSSARTSTSALTTEHGYKYRAVYALNGERIVGFDNERGKGDHRHMDGKQLPYTFAGVDQLVEDFIAAVSARRAP